MSVDEKKLYRQARKQDGRWYLLALFLIVFGFYNTELFSISSMLPCSVLGFWGIGIARNNKLQSKLLNEAAPVVKNLMSRGLTEHDAMINVGVDKFYYKPFWAVR